MAPDPGFRTGLFDDYSARTASGWQVVPGSERVLPGEQFPATGGFSAPDPEPGWAARLRALAFVFGRAKHGRHRSAPGPGRGRTKLG